MFNSKHKYMLFIFIFIMIIGYVGKAHAEDFKEKNSLTFSSLESLGPTISEEEYYDYIRVSILNQPEYAYALSNMSEKNMLLKFEKRHRLPSLDLRVINDKIIDRDVDDLTSIRKRQDDSFDVVVEVNQPIYTGGSINSRIKIARADFTLSKIERDSAFSTLILDANKIYLSAVKSDVLYNYGDDLLNTLRPYLEKVKDRVRLGISDPIELAIFSIKFNNLSSTVQRLRTLRQQDVGIFEYFFETRFENKFFPKVFVPDINLDQRSSYEVKQSELSYESSKGNIGLIRSDYLPKLGFTTRNTNYDVDDSEKSDTDIRGGIYFSVPIFSFGRGSAKISSAKAKANAVKMNIDIARKVDDVRENELVNMVSSSLNTRNEYLNSYLDTKEQRKIIIDRLDVVNFSTDALVNSFIEELSLLQTLLDTEINLIHGYFMYLHQNKVLNSYVGIQP